MVCKVMFVKNGVRECRDDSDSVFHTQCFVVVRVELGLPRVPARAVCVTFFEGHKQPSSSLLGCKCINDPRLDPEGTLTVARRPSGSKTNSYALFPSDRLLG